MYRREIIYIGLYRNEDRVGSAGFLKAESGEQECRLYLKAQNIPLGINGRFPVRIYNGSDWKELSSITVQDGGGCWEESLAGTIERPIVQIRLSGGYALEGRSRTAPETTVGQGAETAQDTAPQSGQDTQERKIEESAADKDRADTRALQPSAEKRAVEQEQREPEAVVVTEELPRRPMRESAESRPGASDFGLKEDKWEQLLTLYEKIHPYGDERVCVKLEPKDFVILRAKYQHLVNNSFLLHGFYNYRYVILGKEHERYYLGVPGVFYEREKMVAQMFGFEAFECPDGEVKTGGFGYYLREVEL